MIGFLTTTACWFGWHRWQLTGWNFRRCLWCYAMERVS